jgi:hypothetical protein
LLANTGSIDELLQKDHLTSDVSKFVRDAVDPASSKWYFANQCLETAREISSLNLNGKDEGQLFLDLGKEVSDLITKLDPEHAHLVLIATKTDENTKEFKIRCAEKTSDFKLNGEEANKLDDIVDKAKAVIDNTNHPLYDFKPNYKDIIKKEHGFFIEKQNRKYNSLVDMMFQTKGEGCKYQFSKQHKVIQGAYNITVPIPPDHHLDKESYYDFSQSTRNVYLIACKISNEIKGVISIDTYSEEKWSTFVMEQLMLIANMVAIAIKQHQTKI